MWLKFLLLELKQELIQGIIIACIIHKVILDNQNNFFWIKKPSLNESLNYLSIIFVVL